MLIMLLSLQDDFQHIRSAYDAFLAEFPLCYGYWKRYAESERRHGSTEAAAAVYERGVAATPYSTELWVAYVALLLAIDAETDTVRRCGNTIGIVGECQYV
jgi:pre-mRNA-processing factor 39